SLPSRFTGEYVNYIAYFLFHVDSLITAYMDELNFIGRNEIPPTNPYLVLVTETGEPRFPLLLGVELALGKAFACLSVNALTYFQNEIILSSTVVHNALIEILTSADGIAGLINVESCDYPLLTDRARIISIDY